jgi:hypothetical protein
VVPALPAARNGHAAGRADQDRADGALLAAVQLLAADFEKDATDSASREALLARETLELICFDYVSS